MAQPTLDFSLPPLGSAAPFAPGPAPAPVTHARVAPAPTIIVKPAPGTNTVIDHAVWARDTAKKLEQAAAETNARFVEREQVVNMFKLAVVAGEHVLLEGDFGVGKTDLTKYFFLEHLQQGQLDVRPYFEYLMNETTDPAAIVGPYSIKGMENDEFRRVWFRKGTLPDSFFGYIDEADKSNPASLNYLLPISNERVMHNDGKVEHVHTHTIVFSANEDFPRGTMALVDRIMFRLRVDDIKDDDNFLKAFIGYEQNINPVTRTKSQLVKFTPDDVLNLHQYAMSIPIPQKISVSIKQLRSQLKLDSFQWSPRRWMKCAKILKAAAAIRGGARVGRSDLAALLDVLAVGPYEDARDDILKRLNGLAVDPMIAEFEKLYRDATADRDAVFAMPDNTSHLKTAKSTQAGKTRATIDTTLSNMDAKIEEAKKGGDDYDELVTFREKVQAARDEVMGIMRHTLDLRTSVAAGAVNMPF